MKIEDIFDKVKKIAVNAFLVITLTVAGSLIVTGLITHKASVFGLRPFYIMSESMEPTIKTGQVVLAVPATPDKVEIGDIVSYRKGYKTIIHRIIDKNDEYFIFKGDNNESEDAPVEYENIGFKIIAY